MKFRDAFGGNNHEIPFSSGALKPPHPKQIGPACLLFLKYEDLVTSSEWTDGVVLGGAPVSDHRIAREMGLPRSSVIAWRRRLVKHGYISARKTDTGFVVRVHKSKKAELIRRLRQAGQNPDQPPVEIPTAPGRDPDRPGQIPTGIKEDSVSKYLQKTTAGDKPPAPARRPPAPTRQATDHAYQSFKNRFGQPPSWSNADYAQAAALFKRVPGLTVGEFVRRWEHYMASTETFARKQCGSLKYFCSRFDGFIAGPAHDHPARRGGGNARSGFSFDQQAAALGGAPGPAD